MRFVTLCEEGEREGGKEGRREGEREGGEGRGERKRFVTVAKDKGERTKGSTRGRKEEEVVRETITIGEERGR